MLHAEMFLIYRFIFENIRMFKYEQLKYQFFFRFIRCGIVSFKLRFIFCIKTLLKIKLYQIFLKYCLERGWICRFLLMSARKKSLKANRKIKQSEKVGTPNRVTNIESLSTTNFVTESLTIIDGVIVFSLTQRVNIFSPHSQNNLTPHKLC